MTRDPSRTYHASQAVHLSDLINLKFSPQRFGTENPRFIRVTEPDGPSTDGGRKARQAILLCAQDEEASGGLVCGFIDITQSRAELRSYAVFKAQFEARFHQEIDITRTEYNRLVDMLQDYLSSQQYTTKIINAPVSKAPQVRSTSLSGASKITALPKKTGTESQTLPALALVLAFGFGFVTCYLMIRFELIPSGIPARYAPLPAESTPPPAPPPDSPAPKTVKKPAKSPVPELVKP